MRFTVEHVRQAFQKIEQGHVVEVVWTLPEQSNLELDMMGIINPRIISKRMTG